jgi:hypothetical protein
MKTAMELLIEKIDKMESKNISVIKIWANELLEKEKQQIIDGFNAGYRESEIDSGIINNHQDIEMFANAEYYFNDTYKTVSN